MSKKTAVEVFIENQKDLEKLKVTVYFEELKYLSDTRKITANLTVKVLIPGPVPFRYHGTHVVATPSASASLSFSLKDPEDTRRIQSQLSEKAENELNEIKKEIGELVEYTPKVAVDLKRVLARIMKVVSE